MNTRKFFLPLPSLLLFSPLLSLQTISFSRPGGGGRWGQSGQHRTAAAGGARAGLGAGGGDSRPSGEGGAVPAQTGLLAAAGARPAGHTAPCCRSSSARRCCGCSTDCSAPSAPSSPGGLERACHHVPHDAWGRPAGDLRHLLSELGRSPYCREARGPLMFTWNIRLLEEDSWDSGAHPPTLGNSPGTDVNTGKFLKHKNI